MADSRDEDERSDAATAMEQADAAGREAGVRLLDVGPGRARTALTVEARHLNGHGICHGGYVFLLADAAFAYACNSYGVSAVAAGADIDFLRPVPLGRRARRGGGGAGAGGPVGAVRRHRAGGGRGGGRVPRPGPPGAGLPGPRGLSDPSGGGGLQLVALGEQVGRLLVRRARRSSRWRRSPRPARRRRPSSARPRRAPWPVRPAARSRAGGWRRGRPRRRPARPPAARGPRARRPRRGRRARGPSGR